MFPSDPSPSVQSPRTKPPPPSSLRTPPAPTRTTRQPPSPSSAGIQTDHCHVQPALVSLSPTFFQPPIPDVYPSNDNKPVQVILVVYDLLPSGKLSDLAWLFGVGLYHTAVKIPALGREIAFGGHAHPQTSGIFSLPIRDDGQPSMPGLRWICEIDMGYVKPGLQPTAGDSCQLRSQASFASSIHFPHEDEESRRLIRPPPSAAKLINKYHSPPSPAYPPTSMPEIPTSPPYAMDRNYRSYASSSTSSDSHKSSPPAPLPPSTPSYSPPTQLETLAFILDQLDRSPDWHGTSYDLLKRNCNTFSNELCMLLTGKGAPKWINRAASVGSSLPCLVPAEWIEPPTAPTPTDEVVSYEDEEEETVHRQQGLSHISPTKTQAKISSPAL